MVRCAFVGVIGVLLGTSLPARADSVTFDFSTPTQILTPSKYSYTFGGLTITAYGFWNNGHNLNLFAKSDGLGETGLGLDGQITGDSDNEIQSTDFVQLDLSKLPPGTAFISMAVGSDQSGEGFQLWGSNQLGTRGTKYTPNGVTVSNAVATLDVSTFPLNDRYLSLQATTGDVLLTSLVVDTPDAGPIPTPEPASLALLGMGGIVISCCQWRRKRLGNRPS
jgi:hypothetical protein